MHHNNPRILLFTALLTGIIVGGIPIASGENVPDWVKNTAGWWAVDSISETEFVNAIEFLVNNDIIQVDTTQSTTTSLIIPDWVKNTAGWWAVDSISETEFVNAIEFLVDNGIISLEKQCSRDLDPNGNNIPDELEIQAVFDPSSNKIIEDNLQPQIIISRNYNNCDFPNEMSHYEFREVDFSNSDLSNKNLFNTKFTSSIFNNTDFSNSKLHGIIFYESSLENVKFENSEFSIMPKSFDRVIFSVYSTENYHHCTFLPCRLHTSTFPGLETTNIQQKLFGKETLPLNLVFEKQVLDLSDIRVSYILSPSFIFNSFENIDFQKANLTYSIFGNNNFNNVDFSESELSEAIFYNSNFFKTKFQETFFDNKTVNMKDDFKTSKKYNESIPKLTFHTDIFKNLQINHVIDFPSINWSMGMLIDDDENILMIANTDDHTIDTFSLDNFELLQSFTSPIQFECETTNTWTKITDCLNEHRNLPTSIAKLNEKIFVAYGWQNEIQIFNSEGEYLYKFGQKGNKSGEFIDPFNINVWEEKLYALDSGNNRIQIFDENSNYEDEFSTNYLQENNSSPVDFSIYDKQIFVTNDLNSNVSRFDLEGQLIDTIDLSTYVDSGSISSIYVNDGMMTITDSSQHQIMVFDLSGQPQLSFGEMGNEYGQFMNSKDVIFDDNMFFISDTNNYRIQIFEIIR
ncbi:pentapeptide repeat-containing protein [Candidatus Nitrosopelagicus sp.]|nr:pentapeptide repeat-containing protein [Candidatus Nitrosopelagicus sp.]